MQATELAEYCRQKGLFADQIAKWWLTCMRANRGGGAAVSPGTLAEERRRNWALEKEVDREMPVAEHATA